MEIKKSSSPPFGRLDSGRKMTILATFYGARIAYMSLLLANERITTPTSGVNKAAYHSSAYHHTALYEKLQYAASHERSYPALLTIRVESALRTLNFNTDPDPDPHPDPHPDPNPNPDPHPDPDPLF